MFPDISIIAHWFVAFRTDWCAGMKNLRLFRGPVLPEAPLSISSVFHTKNMIGEFAIPLISKMGEFFPQNTITPTSGKKTPTVILITPQVITIAVHHSILCHHIRNCSSGPSAGRHTSEINWHAALQKNGAGEMGPL